MTCLILQGIIASAAFHEGYNTGWSYNYFNTNWHPRYGSQYTAGIVDPQDDSSSSSSDTRSSEDLSGSASISNPSTRYKKVSKKNHNSCKCSCEDCYKLIKCCIDKCKLCPIKSTRTARKPKTPTWPPYNPAPTYVLWPYVVPIMYSVKTKPKTSCATTTKRSTTRTTKYTTTTTTPTTTTTTTSSTTTTCATTTTTSATTTTTTTCPTTTTTSSTTTTTTPTTTTTSPTTTTTSPTTTTTSRTTTTTPPTTTTTSPTTTTTVTTTSTEPPKPHSLSSSTHPVPEESTTSSTPTYRVLQSDEETTSLEEVEDDSSTTPHFLYTNTNTGLISFKDYLYYDETTQSIKSSWRDHDYNYYEGYPTTTRINKMCDTPKCLHKKKKIYYYVLKQVADTKPPFMPTKSVVSRKRYSVVDNTVYRDETLKDYYSMVNDEKVNYARQYYYNDYYYYADEDNYNNLPVETVNV